MGVIIFQFLPKMEKILPRFPSVRGSQVNEKDQYILLAEDEPAAAAQLIGDFMQRYQMKGAPPAGVDAQSWFALSETEQQEYIEAGR